MSDQVLARLRQHRGIFQAMVDSAAWLLAIPMAAWLRFEMDLDAWDRERLVVAFLCVAVLQIVIGSIVGLYRRRWRFASFEEASAMISTTIVVTLVFMSVNYLTTPRIVPTAVVVGAGIVATLIMGAARCGWRVALRRRLRPGERATRTIVFGAGEGGEQLVTAMLRNPQSSMLPVGFIDDDPRKQRMRIRGVRVVGDRMAIAEAAKSLRAERLVIAVPSGDAGLYRSVSRLGLDAGLEVNVLPPLERMVGAGSHLGVHESDVRPLDVRDLLGRPQVQTEISRVSQYITGRRVLVTGAGGSIGSELCRQLHRLAPASLVLLDRDESALHKVQLQLEGRALLESRDIVVADIRDAQRIRDVFEEHRPHVVFHAAALKHLPLLELYPCEGTKTNVFGTRNVLEAAMAVDVDRFVNVSTDKAADPTSVLGYTKRIAERLTAHYAEECRGTYLSVRFGNVLGSRGSVLDTFRSQIADGGPVTVVHPEVTRYFMTVEEAVELVIQAGAIGEDGEALVLDMGDPVSIEQVARQLIAQADRPIKIEYTGLRGGEKLHEVLFAQNEIGITKEHASISHVAVPPVNPEDLPFDLGSGQTELIAALVRMCRIPAAEVAGS